MEFVGRIKMTSKKLNKIEQMLEALKALRNSAEGMEMRTRLSDLAKRLGEAEGGRELTEITKDLERTRRILRENRGLNALYGLQAKTLLEEAEFKRTGRRVIID
jgi:hypothetical protein